MIEDTYLDLLTLETDELLERVDLRVKKLAEFLELELLSALQEQQVLKHDGEAAHALRLLQRHGCTQLLLGEDLGEG